MATVSNAVETLRLNKTPIWYLYAGDNKVGQYIESEDSDSGLDNSIDHFQRVTALLAKGTYTVRAADKKSNVSGANHFKFSIGDTAKDAPQPMSATSVSTNPYGIPDLIYQKIQEETEQKLLVKQMHSDLMAFIKEWPEYKKKIDKIDAYLKADSDGDGEPDFLETAKKAAETIKHGTEAAKTFQNLNLFGK